MSVQPVERQDLSKRLQAIKARGRTTGRAAIDPRILLTLWLYAPRQGVGSIREQARLGQEYDAYSCTPRQQPSQETPDN
jgi:hypothetical protein